MTEFENQNSEFNSIQSEYLNNQEYGPVNEKIEDLEEFNNEIPLQKDDESRTKAADTQNQKSEVSSKLSSVQGETAAKSVTASVSSSMGTAVSAIALCVASVGVSAYSDNVNSNVPVVESSVQNVQEQADYVYDDTVVDDIQEAEKLDEQIEPQHTEDENNYLSQFEISSDNYTGTYDGSSHSGSIINIPDGAVITYGKSPDSCILRERPEFTDAGQYTVYYQVRREGYETYYGSYVVNIEKSTVTTPAPSTHEVIYNGKEQSPILNESSAYTYSGIMSATDAGTYKLKLTLTDPKNHKWADGSSEDKVITWVIKPRELTIEWNGQKDYIYNGQKHVIDVTLGNVIPGDFLNFTIKENSAREPGVYNAEVISFGGSKNYILPKQCNYNWIISEK